MEALLLTGIGLAATGYVIYIVWRNVNGKSGCNCVCSDSCPSGGCSARTEKRADRS